MKISGHLSVFAACWIATTPSYCGPSPVTDNPEPVMSATHAVAFGDKRAEVELILFKDAFASNVRARVRVALLPGGFESMTFVTEKDGAYKLVYLYSQHLIGHYAMPAPTHFGASPKPPPDPKSATVIRKQINISSSLAFKLITSLKKLLLQTKYQTNHQWAFDGSDVTISMEDETGEYAGHFWDPVDSLPRLQAMHTVATDLAMACGFDPKAKDPCEFADLATLKMDVDALAKVLGK